MALNKKDLEAIGEIVGRKLDERFASFEKSTDVRFIDFEKRIRGDFEEKLNLTKREIIAYVDERAVKIEATIKREIDDLAEIIKPIIHDVALLKAKVGLTNSEE